MKFNVLACILVAVMGCACTDSGARLRQSDASYESAINGGEACCGSYVLITIINGATGERRTTCTLGGYLLSAMWIESGLPDTSETSERLRHDAIRNQRRAFTFYKIEALRNMPPTFTDADIEQVREATRGMSPKQALEAMKAGGVLAKLKLQGNNLGYDPLRDAVACSFVERGGSAGIPDFGSLWIVMPSKPPASQASR